MQQTERRTTVIPVSLRTEGGADGQEARTIISGYAAVFSKENSPLDAEARGFVETIDPHAFDGTIAVSDVVALFEHDQAQGVLARCDHGKGSLSLNVDDRGLAFSFEIPDTQLGHDVATSVRRGDITGMSFAFRVDKEEWQHNDSDDSYRRTILHFSELFDISLVVRPAYPGATVTAAEARSAAAQRFNTWAAANGHTPVPAPTAAPADNSAVYDAYRALIYS